MCFLIQDRGWRLISSLVYFSHVLSSYFNEISCLRNLVSRAFTTHFSFHPLPFCFDPSNSSAVIPTIQSLLGYVNIYFLAYFISNECMSDTRVI